ASRSGFAGWAFAAATGEQLPPIVTGDSWIVVERDETGTVEFGNIKPAIFFMCIKRTAQARRVAVMAVAPGACDADPISVARFFAGIFARLINAALVDGDIAHVVPRVGLPGLDQGQARKPFLDWFVSADNAHALQPRALVPRIRSAAWRHARDNPTQAPSAPQPRLAQKTHWQVQCIVRPVLCSRSKSTWFFGSMAAATLKVPP